MPDRSGWGVVVLLSVVAWLPQCGDMFGTGLRRRSSLLALAFLLVACVQIDPATGEMMPRGDQRYEFSRVKEYAESLQIGMTPYQVVMLIGSPAERTMRGETWVYLPERPAVLVPGRALKLEFRFGQLHDFGYHLILLGKAL